MFIIAAEITVSKIRQSNEIRGIELPSIDHDKKEAKITQFADDTTIFARDELSLCNVIKELDKLTVISGLHLNKTKFGLAQVNIGRKGLAVLTGSFIHKIM